jgi:hypothetical protein
VQTVFLHFRESVLGIPARSSIAPPAPATLSMDLPSGERLTPLVDTKKSVVGDELDIAIESQGEGEPHTEREQEVSVSFSDDGKRRKKLPKEVTSTLKSGDS